jgi:hypothetical protein
VGWGENYKMKRERGAGRTMAVAWRRLTCPRHKLSPLPAQFKFDPNPNPHRMLPVGLCFSPQKPHTLWVVSRGNDRVQEVRTDVEWPWFVACLPV